MATPLSKTLRTATLNVGFNYSKGKGRIPDYLYDPSRDIEVRFGDANSKIRASWVNKYSTPVLPLTLTISDGSYIDFFPKPSKETSGNNFTPDQVSITAREIIDAISKKSRDLSREPRNVQ